MTSTAKKTEMLPPVRGEYRENAPLGAVGWFRAGGTADVLFKPADKEDLQQFLAGYIPSPAVACAPAPSPVGRGRGPCEAGEGEGKKDISIFGVLSNTIVRDGGMRGVTVRLGKEFTNIEVLPGNRIRAGALALDARVAKAAAEVGISGLEFFSGIPGTIGGALRMNAGCYGTETKDVLIEAEALDRVGNIHHFTSCHPEGAQRLKDPAFKGRSFAGAQDDMNLSYRHNDLSPDYIFTAAIFQGQPGDPEKIAAHMTEIKTRREASQPIREKTGGSTFANPTTEEIAAANLPEGTKVWQLIDRAKCRGLTLGGAVMSEKHCNFMINTGTATAADLENLGEEVRRRVYEDCGITLKWEIKRVGELEK
jgi:UDP-N-acetylmuramate dehydrogenase